mmetsp:Transcript_31307/g.96719  ORF Transcript_31307/g.96719 Transcript_31307/m.96719 type:complete len:212 (-) Transcript_31307:1071-1706(-)
MNPKKVERISPSQGRTPRQAAALKASKFIITATFRLAGEGEEVCHPTSNSQTWRRVESNRRCCGGPEESVRGKRLVIRHALTPATDGRIATSGRIIRIGGPLLGAPNADGPAERRENGRVLQNRPRHISEGGVRGIEVETHRCSKRERARRCSRGDIGGFRRISGGRIGSHEQPVIAGGFADADDFVNLDYFLQRRVRRHPDGVRRGCRSQ